MGSRHSAPPFFRVFAGSRIVCSLECWSHPRTSSHSRWILMSDKGMHIVERRNHEASDCGRTIRLHASNLL